MTQLIPVWAGAAIFMAVVMALAWVVQQRTGQGGWADAFWSFGLGLAGIGVALFPFEAEPFSLRQMVVAALIGLWGLRLGSHIAARAVREKEDARYARLREEWGDRYRLKMFGFLMLQAGAASLLVFSVMLAAHNPASKFGLMDILAVIVFLVALMGEATADRQLKTFKAQNTQADRICDVGLWAWSRHPNYFFEWLGWCAWPLLAINISSGWIWGGLALSAPAYIYWLLNAVSGVPLTEAHMKRTRPEAFADYARRTSRFFPRPPKS